MPAWRLTSSTNSRTRCRWQTSSAVLRTSVSRHNLYVLAFTIVRADETITGGERIYLAQLAHKLGLDAATAARLETSTAAAIDATPVPNS